MLRTAGKQFVLFVTTVSAMTASAVQADETDAVAGAFKTTTELGITITEGDLIDALDESCSFWPAVRRHLTSADFKAAEPEVRLESERQIRAMQDQLHARLMESDDESAADLLEFATWNLRKIRLYQNLRTLLGDSRSLISLRQVWQQAHRPLAGSSKSIAAETPIERIAFEMKPLGLTSEQTDHAIDLWAKIEICNDRGDATATARLIRDYDKSLGDGPAAVLTRDIVLTVDWASIIKPRGAALKREHFVEAWHELHRPPLEVTASAVGGQ